MKDVSHDGVIKMKQLIIARKDLNMSPGKLAAQVSHASMAFLTDTLRARGEKILECSRGRAWEYRIIPQNQIEKYKQNIEKHNKEILERYPDSDYKEELVFKDGKWYKKIPQEYRRSDLYQWAKETRARGEEYFYYRPVNFNDPYGKLELCEPTYHIKSDILFDMDIWNDWICGSFTKVICEAKNKYQLEKVINIATDLNMLKGIDYFLIKDNCYTELTPEEIDENGIGRTLTCIGFRPLPDDIVHKISKKYQLYR